LQRIESLAELASFLGSCNKCELRGYGSKPVPGTGASNAKLFVVGEAPSYKAELERQPFVGWTGDYLARCLEYISLPREEVYMTNAVKCALREKTGNIRRNGHGPYGQHLLACHPWLEQELHIVNSKIVLAIGWAALNALLGISVGTFHQKGYCQEINGRFYCAIYHPGRHSGVLREEDKKMLDQIRSLLSSACMSDK